MLSLEFATCRWISAFCQQRDFAILQIRIIRSVVPLSQIERGTIAIKI